MRPAAAPPEIAPAPTEQEAAPRAPGASAKEPPPTKASPAVDMPIIDRKPDADPAAPAPSASTAPASPGTSALTPEKMPTVPGEDRHEGLRPDGWVSARDNKPDDLRRIKGIGPQNEGRLHGLGVWHFDQIAAWTPDNVKWVGSYLAFHGRIDREKWIDQAKALASGIETDVSKRVTGGKVVAPLDDGSLGQKSSAPTTKRSPRRR